MMPPPSTPQDPSASPKGSSASAQGPPPSSQDPLAFPQGTSASSQVPPPSSGSMRTLTLPIIIVSIAIPAAVAFLILVPQTKISFGFNTRSLPFVYAILNACTSILLLASLYFIKNGQIRAHRTANLTAVTLSVLFLIFYVIYHASNASTKYGDLNHDGVLSESEKLQAGSLRYIYYFILSSHILLSIVVIPLVLFTLQKAFQARFDKHRKLARITWPVWFYVAVTGVVVYLMISPYY
jgi:putative membrane protein